MEIIRDELRYVLNCSLDDSPHCEYSSREVLVHRLKDIEWVSKKHEAVKKSLRGATGTANLQDKAKKEELDCLTKVLDHLENGGKDVRKGEWTTKDVRSPFLLSTTSKPNTEERLRNVDWLHQRSHVAHC